MNMRAAVLLAVSLLVSGSTAQAHDKVNTQQVAATGSYCVYESSLMREDNVGNGYARGRVRTYKSDCGTAVNRDVGFLSQALRIWYSTNVDNQQRLCVYTNFYYNGEPAWAFGLWLQFPDRAYCGAGWYEIEAAGHFWSDGAWRGGSTWSGRHFLNL